MSCKECKEPKDISLPMKNYTDEELEQAHLQGNKSSYTQDEIAWFYNLYNRVFKTHKSPGCGKCFVNIRKHLTNIYQNGR
jgi:hypothetical protein